MSRWITIESAELAVKALEEENARIKAEVERLRKAGDALENWIAWECESPVGTAEGIRDAWNAAKEGKSV